MNGKVSIPWLFFLVLLLFMVACSKEDKNDYGDEKNGYALESAEGHRFKFFNSKKQSLFRVAINDGEVIAVVDNGGLMNGDPTFEYERTGKNSAECWVGIPYEVMHGLSGGYFGRLELTFVGPKNGTYDLYDVVYDNYKSSGTFVVDGEY